MSGPADVWFGIGFGASTMNDKPYAIIVDGNGNVTERKLENHGPGSLLSNSVTGKPSIILGKYSVFDSVKSFYGRLKAWIDRNNC